MLLNWSNFNLRFRRLNCPSHLRQGERYPFHDLHDVVFRPFQSGRFATDGGEIYTHAYIVWILISSAVDIRVEIGKRGQASSILHKGEGEALELPTGHVSCVSQVLFRRVQPTLRGVMQAHPHSCLIDERGKYGLISDLGLDRIYATWMFVKSGCINIVNYYIHTRRPAVQNIFPLQPSGFGGLC